MYCNCSAKGQLNKRGDGMNTKIYAYIIGLGFINVRYDTLKRAIWI